MTMRFQFAFYDCRQEINLHTMQVHDILSIIISKSGDIKYKGTRSGRFFKMHGYLFAMY